MELKRSKKRILFILIACVMVMQILLLSGCGGKDDDEVVGDTLVTDVTIDGDDTILVGGVATYTATVKPSTATTTAVSWSCVNGTGEGEITSDGKLTAKAAGTVTIKAVANDDSKKEGSKVVTIQSDDTTLGLPRPTAGSIAMLATEANITKVENTDWSVKSSGIEVDYARNVVDVTFDGTHSTSTVGIAKDLDADLNLAKSQYFAIKLGGEYDDVPAGVITDVKILNKTNNKYIWLDQSTDIDLTIGNAYGGKMDANSETIWVVFNIANTYALGNPEDLQVEVIPATAGYSGKITIYDMCFVGAKAIATEEVVLGGFTTRHWEASPVVTAKDVYATDTVGAHKEITFTEAAVSGWNGSSAYIYDNITRYETLTVEMSMNAGDVLATDGGLVPNFMFEFGTTTMTATVISGNATADPTNGQIKFTDNTASVIELAIPQGTEKTLLTAKEIVIKPAGDATENIVVKVFSMVLAGDRNPDAEPAYTYAGEEGTTSEISLLSSKINHLEGAAVTDGDNGELVVTSSGTADVKLDYQAWKTGSNTGYTGIKVTFTGVAGSTLNVQKGWSDSWADEANRKVAVTGEEQTFIAYGSVPYSDDAVELIFSGLQADDVITITSLEFIVQFVETPEAQGDDINAKSYNDKGSDETTTSTLTDNGISLTVGESATATSQANAFFVDANIKNMNTLNFDITGVEGEDVTVLVSFGSKFNGAEEYTVACDGTKQNISITIADRSALLTDSLTITIVTTTAAGTYTIENVHFSAV